MSYFEAVLETLQGIQKEVKATRHAILHQTKLLQESKETPKEAAPAPKAITWKEAVQALCMYCSARRCAECEAKTWCNSYRTQTPNAWYIPHVKVEVLDDKEKED